MKQPAGAIPVESRPADTITDHELAEEMGISRSTMYEHLQKHGFAHYAMPKPGRKRENERYLSSEQAQVIRDWHATRSKRRASEQQ